MYSCDSRYAKRPYSLLQSMLRFLLTAFLPLSVRTHPDDTGDGELITLIHHSVTFIYLSSDDSITEHITITATINNITVNIHNIYIPLSPVVPPISHQTLILSFNFRVNIIMRDFNAHNPGWHSQTTCTLAEAMLYPHRQIPH